MIFEHFAFRSALIAPAPALVIHDPQSAAAAGGVEDGDAAGAAAAAAALRAHAALVLDCGFSYTCATTRAAPRSGQRKPTQQSGLLLMRFRVLLLVLPRHQARGAGV
jgi:hypothetical protein